MALPDESLAALRTLEDAALGIDRAFVDEAMKAFAIAPSARLSRVAAQGTFHRLYKVGEGEGRARLLRVAAIAGDEFARLMALECAVMDALRASGFPVPACEFRGLRQAGVERGVHLLEHASGASLSTMDDEEPRMRQALGWVARFLRTLHRVRGSGFGPLSATSFATTDRAFVGVHARWADYVFTRLDDHIDRCASIGAIAAGEARDIGAAFEAARPRLDRQPAALLHGDPGSHNFMLDDIAIRAVLDWEDALLGDPLFDLASLCTFHPERRHAAIWSGYGANLAADKEKRALFWLYFLRIALAKTVHRHRFGYADRPGREPASRRIQLALGRLKEAG